MDKNDLVNLMNDIFKSLGYKKKGNYWISVENTLTKSVDLQKSNFSKQYYINYGFIINHLELITTRHISYRLSGSIRITELLNLEDSLKKEDQLTELKIIIQGKIKDKLQAINTESELLDEIKKLPTLNMVPLVVKNYFGLPIE